MRHHTSFSPARQRSRDIAYCLVTAAIGMGRLRLGRRHGTQPSNPLARLYRALRSAESVVGAQARALCVCHRRRLECRTHAPVVRREVVPGPAIASLDMKTKGLEGEPP